MNKWIREILKVTKLDRDPSSGTALQALLRLQEKREGIHYQEFKKVMSQCHEVLNIWDDEYDKLQGLMRDNLEKGDTHLKMVWHVNVSHKRRQERMQHMVKFRRQHEQRAREATMVVWLDELQYQKGVWSKLSRRWEQIDEFKDKPWLSVQHQHRKLRQQIDGLLSQLKNLPDSLRQYAT